MRERPRQPARNNPDFGRVSEPRPFEVDREPFVEIYRDLPAPCLKLQRPVVAVVPQVPDPEPAAPRRGRRCKRASPGPTGPGVRRDMAGVRRRLMCRLPRTETSGIRSRGHSHSANRSEGIQDGGVSRHERFEESSAPQELSSSVGLRRNLHRKAAGQATRQLCGTKALGLPTRPGIDGPRVGPRVEFRGLSGAEFLLSEAGSRLCAPGARESPSPSS